MNAEERANWLAERRKGIGGSDAGAILGYSKWATPMKVWMDKVGRLEPEPENEAMRTGTFLEQYVADRYAETTGRTVRKHNFMIHGDGDRSCLLANLDRLVVPVGESIAAFHGEIRTDLGLECKTAGWDWDAVPLTYQAQVQHYMGLCPTIRRMDVAVLHRNSLKFEIWPVERDDELIEWIQSEEIRFWNSYVLPTLNGKETPPPPVNEDDCIRLWSRHNPGKKVEFGTKFTDESETDENGGHPTYDVAELAMEYRRLDAEEKAYKDRKGGIKSLIIRAMADAESVLGENGLPLVTYKAGKEKTVTTVDWEAVAKDAGASDEMIAAHTDTRTEIGSRRFLIPKSKVA